MKTTRGEGGGGEGTYALGISKNMNASIIAKRVTIVCSLFGGVCRWVVK